MNVISVAAYTMNICRFNVGELKELDQAIERTSKQKHIGKAEKR